MKLFFPTFSITNPIYVNCKASVNIKIADQSGYVIKETLDYEGGYHPSHPLASVTPNNRHNNHPTDSDLEIPVGTVINILVQNLSKNGVPFELELFRPRKVSEESEIVEHLIKQVIKAGERRTFTIEISDYQPDGNKWYKLNCNVQNGLDFTGACTTTIPTIVLGNREIWQNPSITEESQKAWMPYTPTGGGGSTPTPTPVVDNNTNTIQLLPGARQSNKKPTPEEIIKYVLYGVVIIVIILILLILYRNVQRKNSDS